MGRRTDVWEAPLNGDVSQMRPWLLLGTAWSRKKQAGFLGRRSFLLAKGGCLPAPADRLPAFSERVL